MALRVGGERCDVERGGGGGVGGEEVRGGGEEGEVSL